METCIWKYVTVRDKISKSEFTEQKICKKSPDDLLSGWQNVAGHHNTSITVRYFLIILTVKITRMECLHMCKAAD